MRGKKTDSVFIASFIREAVAQGIQTPEEIVKRAKAMINQIDEEIKSIESKKITRSKLLDVVASFERQTKDNAEEAKLLSLFDIEYPVKCKEICDILKGKGSITIEKTSDATTKFCYKQMLERKILSRKDNVLTAGERFDDYTKFVLQEAQC